MQLEEADQSELMNVILMQEKNISQLEESEEVQEVEKI